MSTHTPTHPSYHSSCRSGKGTSLVNSRFHYLGRRSFPSRPPRPYCVPYKQAPPLRSCLTCGLTMLSHYTCSHVPFLVLLHPESEGVKPGAKLINLLFDPQFPPSSLTLKALDNTMVTDTLTMVSIS